MRAVKTFEIIELDEFRGRQASIYSLAINGETETLFDKFLEEYDTQYPDEVDFLVARLEAICQLGARPNFFRPTAEGAFGKGDGVEALFDQPNANLRLYCIKFGSFAIIVGGGGYKPKSIRAFQEDPKLTDENYLLRALSLRINQAFKDGSLWWEGNRLAGNLFFEND